MCSRGLVLMLLVFLLFFCPPVLLSFWHNVVEKDGKVGIVEEEEGQGQGEGEGEGGEEEETTMA